MWSVQRTDFEMKQQQNEDVPFVKFIYLLFTRMLHTSNRRRYRSLLLCYRDVFRPLTPFVGSKDVGAKKGNKDATRSVVATGCT